MFPRLLVLAALLSSSSGESSASGPQTVLAFVGQHVVLPCSYNVNVHDDFPTSLEWSWKDPKNVVILYRNGCEEHDMKDPAYLYRTSLITPELKNGNISVRIADVRLSDDGLYTCTRLWLMGPSVLPDTTAVRLLVVAVSEPELSVVSPQSGWSLGRGETLQCKATCWLPMPKIHFLDNQGSVIPAETEPKWSQEASGCYNVTRSVTLQSPIKRVTCRVHQPETNQSRDKHISVPARPQEPWITVQTIFFVLVGLILGLILGLVICGVFCRGDPCGCAAKKQPVTRQPSEQSSSSADSSVLNRTTETLTREDSVPAGRSDDNTPWLSPVVCQLDQPTLLPTPVASPSNSPAKYETIPRHPGPKPDISRQNPAWGHSVPSPDRRPSLDVSTSSGQSAVKAAKKKRSMSDSSAHARGPKFHRQTSLSSSLNRYAVLSDLKEESERLMSEK